MFQITLVQNLHCHCGNVIRGAFPVFELKNIHKILNLEFPCENCGRKFIVRLSLRTSDKKLLVLDKLIQQISDLQTTMINLPDDVLMEILEEK